VDGHGEGLMERSRGIAIIRVLLVTNVPGLIFRE
jgi:hypothetical protein